MKIRRLLFALLLASVLGVGTAHAQTACGPFFSWLSSAGGWIVWMAPGDNGFVVNFGAEVYGQYFEGSCWFA